MKYIDAEKLNAEIERRILQEQGFEDGDAEYGYKCALKDIKRFIDSLQQEQSEVELEKEIYKWIAEGDITDIRFGDYDDLDIERTARHFYELGRNARKEE